MINLTILLENLRELSSKEIQENLWLHGDKYQMSSFTEAICGVFDDAGLTRAVETLYLKNNFSKELCHKVKKLDQLINLIPEELPPEEIINHPKMPAIRILSSELLGLFKNEAEN